ncbi:MAG: LptF/LptG family permease [Candidatus Eisenbacteria bacterium]|uniref:LptF/LptG family permease n=1 Tax=Eiseniibacteriota bacterium TaxID=2212470 RepID=A0A948W611_UNCEI|nr:LptF/LptG family permease [Candidatus Eisenbacteria bacterium]
MKILDRHLLREFLLFSTIGFVAFVGIFVIVDLFEKIDIFIDHKASIPVVIQYYLFGLPLVIIEVIPIALLLGAVLSLGQLKKWGELTAMQVSGFTPLRILAPLLVAGAAISVGTLLINEQVTPNTTRMQEELYRTKIRGRQHTSGASRSDILLLGHMGRIYLAASYEAPTKILRTVSVQHPKKGAQELEWRLDAQRATWRNEIWEFRTGILRRFLEEQEIGVRFNKYADSRLEERPEDFARPEGDPLYMSRTQLRQYICRLGEGGVRVQKYEVNYHIRGSFPFSSLVMVLLGSVLSLRNRRGGNVALGVGLSLFLGFAYFAFIRVGQAFGYHATLPPLLSAWLGNITFSIIGLFLLWRAHR